MLYGINDILRNTLGFSSHSEKLRTKEFWAVNNVSFEVKKGETLGLIGPNGSGKTTLLKMLNGIFWPDTGKITIKGRVGSLIEVGAGFHPMLTGKENIYINGAILGMTKKELNEKFNDIVEFADIGDFINSPVKFYSSGMFVRLGFAIAAHCNADILLIDEILAVGDASFRRKCSEHMKTFMSENKSVVLVSHNMALVDAIADNAILLKDGKKIASGEVKEVIAEYDLITSSSETKLFDVQNEIHGEEGGLKLIMKYAGHSTDEIYIKRVWVESKDRKTSVEYLSNEDVTLCISYEVREGLEIRDGFIWIAFINEDGINCMGTRIRLGEHNDLKILPQFGITRVHFWPFQLTTGIYKISIVFLDYTSSVPYVQGHYGYVKVISDIPTQKPGINTPVCWPRCEWSIDSLN